jgi:hypothetical protein
MVTDLFVPSSVMVALLGAQFTGAASVLACSNAKSDVFGDGQETTASPPERMAESVGRGNR